MHRSMIPIGCFLSLLVAIAGCELDGQMVLATRCFDTTTETYVCCDPDTPESYAMCDAGTDAGSSASADASDGTESDAGADDGGPPASVCPWPCTSTGGGGFNAFPSYVWIEGETPTPQPLTGIPWTSWIDVEFAEPNCPSCTCVAPTLPEDGCRLPIVWNAESTTCQEASLPNITPFDPPSGWTGSCTSTNPIAGGLLCNDAPCVRSLVVQPPAIEPCIAAPAMPPEGQPLPPPQRTKVVEYVAAASSGTCDETTNCIAPPPEGYKLCFVADDLQADAECPTGWTDRYSGWRDVDDARACSACACGTPRAHLAKCAQRCTPTMHAATNVPVSWCHRVKERSASICSKARRSVARPLKLCRTKRGRVHRPPARSSARSR